MSEYPQLLRRPLPPKDAIPAKSCELKSRPPDKIPTKNAESPKGERKKEYAKESDSTNQLETPCCSSAPNKFLSWDFAVCGQDDLSFAEDDLWYSLNGFLQEPSVRVPRLQSKGIVLSRYNYEKIMRLLAAELRNQNQEKVNIVELPIDDIPPVLRRVPERQRTIEMIAAARHLENDLKSGIGPELPGYTGAGPSIEGDNEIVESSDSESLESEEKPEGNINPYALLVLRTLAIRKDSLNLRGHFLHQLPDLTALVSILKYLNLSFNTLQDIPVAIYRFSHLEVLNLRDNPIEEISSDIAKLTNLRIFNVSFCQISTLPDGLFRLSNLQSLNVAYNKISVISNDIKNLRKLQFLNIAGNELTTLPNDLLQLKLKQLRLENNYLHPLFWEENARNQPQRLTDLAAVTFSKGHLIQQHTNIPKEVQAVLNNATMCECCRGPLFGPGIKLIKPRKTVFHTESLPFLYHACSPSCHKWFISKSG
ncbi:leucine-rich repeat-containing protein 63-like [Stegostoma tigrinum]|uniref:leucine-rich repeat-containing protein 63-like n=1 Tax=Stegostoma tigrinum TaxID=3053191 RepID=UPI00202B3089|nr:leucine-rich repeat-containing protein 63-like [Stegostoma tigrinum]XP_048396199.1 leucine-rich repeat-containing protein 63-like [Stegostoma tigrinum]XP_048396200.1 leucine-rich repeat-containing protein 63-like [Stegostoma tigrinum]